MVAAAVSQVPSATAAAVDFSDVQGLVRFGHGQLAASSFVLMRVVDRRQACAWLATAPVTSAVATKPLPTTALQIGLTSAGLRALGVPEAVVAGFSPEFVVGMGTDPARARRLGDVGPSAPQRWAWGIGETLPHVLLQLYATPQGLAAWKRDVLAACAAGLEPITSLDSTEVSDTEPFGFADGVSQPLVDWERRRPARDETILDYGNRVCLGEFLLGYPDEYGGYADRPLVDATPALPSAEDEPSKGDVGRNGSYLVLRQLRQDVRGFWRFLDRRADGNAGLRLRWAEAIVGRTRDGESLVGLTTETVDGLAKPVEQNAFTYRSDPEGLRCPLGAHVRRANPRNADLPDGAADNWVRRLLFMLGLDARARRADFVSSTRFHRLLRRGREYGPKLTVEQALDAAGPPVDSGLFFVCLGANIARQFEFVQGAWLMSAQFDGLRDERDPLLGHRLPDPDGAPTDAFSIPDGRGPDERLTDLPAFVTVAGGAYFFLPGLRALRYLATCGAEASP